MLEENIYLSNLYDYYDVLLTDKQKRYFQDYYFDNLTVQEIADNYDISKNAVSKSLIETKEKLEELEDKLHLYANKEKIKEILDKDIFDKIEEYL